MLSRGSSRVTRARRSRRPGRFRRGTTDTSAAGVPDTSSAGYQAVGQEPPFPPAPFAPPAPVTPPAPPQQGAPSGPTFTPHSPAGRSRPVARTASLAGPRHGQRGRPRPTFTPREGYAPSGERERPAPAPTAFLPPVPAGYPQPSFQPYRLSRGAAKAGAAVRAYRARRCPRPTGQPHQGARARGRPGLVHRAAAAFRGHLAQPRQVEQGDGARHARLQGDRVPAHVRVLVRARPLLNRRRLQHGQHSCPTPSTT